MLKEPIRIVPNRRDFLRLVGVGTTAPVSYASSPSRLYLVSASPQSARDSVFPVVLFALDAHAARVSWATTLIRAGLGRDYVLSTFDHRTVVAAETTNETHRVVILHIASPGEPQAVEVALEGRSLSSRHIVKSGHHLKLALQFGIDQKRDFFEVDLRDYRISRTAPTDLYKDFVIDGFVGGIIANNNFAFVRQTADTGRLEYMGAIQPVPLSVSLPAGIRLTSDDKSAIGLYVANAELLVFREASNERAKTTSAFVLVERSKGGWHTIEMPGN